MSDAGTMYANAKALHELLQESRAENAKLREEFDKMDKWHSAELIAAMKDNAKLRELVRDMWNWLAPTAVGGGAPLKGLYNRMRELGVDA